MDPQVSTETLVGSYELSEDWEVGETYTLSFEATKTAEPLQRTVTMDMR